MPGSVETVESIYASMAAGDVAAVLEHLSPDVVLEQDPALPWGGRFVGADGVVEFATKLVSTIQSAVTTEAMYAAADDVVQYGRTKGTVVANGATFDIPECHVWTFDGDRVVHVRFYIDSAAMLEALNG